MSGTRISRRSLSFSAFKSPAEITAGIAPAIVGDERDAGYFEMRI
jgi:hypothetical protein